MSYDAILNAWKRVKDVIVFGVAGLLAVASSNVIGLSEQCPEATLTIFGSTVGLKVVIDFIANWQKHKNDV